MLYQLRLKRGQPVSWNIQLQFARGCDHLLGTAAVTVIAWRPGLGAEVIAQFGCQHSLHKLFLELAGRSGLTQDRFGILVQNLR